MSPSRNPQVLSGFRPFFDAFERLGADRAGLMRAAGLTKEDFENPDTVLSDAACAAFFGEGAQRCGSPDFGLRVAEQIPLGAFPLLDYLVMTSPTVGDGFQQLSRFLRLVGSPADLRIRDTGDPIRVRMAVCSPFNAEFTLALAVLHFRRETGGTFHAAALHFRHRPDDTAEMEKRLGCPVRAGAEADELAIARSVWRLPLRRRDSALHGLLASQAEEMLARAGPGESASRQIRRALANRIAAGTTDLATIARGLGASPRTLQRRLEQEGTSFQEILEDVRREAAESYLSDSTLSCAEVGYVLGFSEPAAFHRAFKRWSGVTPLDFRKARSLRTPRALRTSRRPRASRPKSRPPSRTS